MNDQWKKVFWFLGIGVLIAALPFGEEPHLLQKWKLFVNGWLHKPIDWLDFAFHGLPLLFVASYVIYLISIRLIVALRQKR